MLACGRAAVLHRPEDSRAPALVTAPMCTTGHPIGDPSGFSEQALKESHLEEVQNPEPRRAYMRVVIKIGLNVTGMVQCNCKK